MKKDINFLNGNLFKSILIVAIPLILSNLLQVLFNLADIMVVGKFDGDTALGAVGSTATLVTLFTGFLIGMSASVNVVVARYVGEGNTLKASKTVHTSFITMLIVGIILFLLGHFFARDILIILNTDIEFLDLATSYLKLYFIGMPAMAIYNFGAMVYSAIGDTKKPLIFLSISGILNIILNLFLVIVVKLSVNGVAIASFSSLYISAILIIISLIKSKKVIKLDFRKLHIDKEILSKLLVIGLPSGIQACIFAIANLFIQSGVNSLGSLTIKGNSAAMNADTIVYDVMAAFYIATSSFVSQNYGAKKYDRVKNSFLVCLVYSCGIGLILGVLLEVFANQFLMCFTDSQEVIAEGRKRLEIMAFSYFLSGFMDSATAACRGLGKTLIPTITMILGSCIFRIIWLYTVFAHFNSIEGLYSLYPVSWVITSILEIIYFIYLFRHKCQKEY